MATMEATRLRPIPGRYRELMATLTHTCEYLAEHFGESVRVRMQEWQVADATVGQISVQLIFQDQVTRARILDRLRIEGARYPLTAALQSSTPPALLAKRMWCDGADTDLRVPAARRVTSYTVFDVTKGREPEADAAFAEAEERHQRLGADPSLWVIRLAADGLGRYVRELGFDGYEEFDAFLALNRAAMPPEQPMEYAIRQGVVRRLSWSLAVALDV
jgi:hypothetical protein